MKWFSEKIILKTNLPKRHLTNTKRTLTKPLVSDSTPSCEPANTMVNLSCPGTEAVSHSSTEIQWGFCVSRPTSEHRPSCASNKTNPALQAWAPDTRSSTGDHLPGAEVWILRFISSFSFFKSEFSFSSSSTRYKKSQNSHIKRHLKCMNFMFHCTHSKIC